jgi:cation diffusion facilitator family transporter
LKQIRTESPDPKRQRLYRNAILIALGGNALLAAAKSVLAWITGSSAIFSDAINSLSDMLYSLLMSVGLYVSQRPADEDHPQGHARFEPLVSLFIAGAMTVAGGTAVWKSIQRFLSGGGAVPAKWPTVVLLGSVILKVGMYLLVNRIGDEAQSPAIQASARDNLADILTSTAALLGVWGARLINPIFDPIAGFLVGLWIFRATVEIVRENIGYLTGRGAPQNLCKQIAEAARNVPNVEGVHQVIADYVGPRLRVDMHVEIDGDVTLQRAHEIGENVRTAIKEIPQVDLVFIHLEPIGGDHPH